MLLWRAKVGILILAQGKGVTFQAHALALPFLAPTAPRLHEMVLLGGGAPTPTALGKVLVAGKACCPLYHRHNLEPRPLAWIDLHWVAVQKLRPLDLVQGDLGGIADGCDDGCPQVGVVLL